MSYMAVFMLVGVTIFCPFASSKSLVPKYKDWDYLIFSHFWPPSSCIYLEEKNETCSIPSDIHGWTIHGLWPSIPGTEKPQFCNASMPFNYTEIEKLGPQLDKNWHFYDPEKARTYLWQHEWEKHGTCAYTLPTLRGEMNYFNSTLQLHSQVNLTRALEASGIVPSLTKTYNMNDFNDALEKYYKVKTVTVCDYDSKDKKTYIDQIYLCYDKNLKLQDCYKPSQSLSNSRKGPEPNYFDGCEEKDKIYYLSYNTAVGHKSGSPLVFRSEIPQH